MKKLFLLPAIALVAVLAISSVSASMCCYTDSNCALGYQKWPGGGCKSVCFDNGYDSCKTFDDSQNSCKDPCIVPEFTSLGMGIALIGAGAGYALIRRKRK